jgi:hypothetical protein
MAPRMPKFHYRESEGQGKAKQPVEAAGAAIEAELAAFIGSRALPRPDAGPSWPRTQSNLFQSFLFTSGNLPRGTARW